MRCLKVLPLPFLVFGLCAAPLPTAAQSANGSIGIFADQAGEDARLQLTQGVPATLYIVAHLEGDTALGMQGAEFRITGMPEGWAVSSTANPLAAVTLGNPFTYVNDIWRANIAFGACVGTDDSTVVLYTVNVFPTSEVSDHPLTVEAGLPPSNPTLDTPLMNLCDAPYYTAVPVLGRTAVINPAALLPDPAIASCDIRVSNSSPVAGEAVFLQARVRNPGSIDLLPSVAVRFLMDGVPFGNDVDTGPIAVGGVAVASSSLPWNVDFDVHQVTVIVDPDSLLEEEAEGNNSAMAGLPYDLQVESLSWCPPPAICSFCAGDSITMDAEIRNAGLFDVASVDVEFQEALGDWSVRVLAEDVLAGSSCSTGVVVSTRYLASVLGANELTATVDPDDVLPEFDESNNGFSRYLLTPCVSDFWHDYRVLSCDIVASNPQAAPGDLILLQAVVANIGGPEGLGPTTVRFALDGQPLGADVPLASIAAGDSVVVSIPWTVSLDPHQLTVHVDPDSQLTEFNRSNNQAAAVLPYDFSVQTVLEGPGSTCVGDSMFVSALVSNAGVLSADSVRVRFTSSSGDTTWSVVPFVPAKTYCGLPVPTPSGLQHVLEQGSNSVLAWVDRENLWPELDENNNLDSEHVWASYCDIDLVVTDVQYTLPSLDPGTVLEHLLVEVWTGGPDLTGVRCSVFIDGSLQCFQFLVYPTSTPGVLRGYCTNDWIVPEPPGADHELLVCVDPADSFTELNEDNNCLSETIQATGPSTPVSLTGLEAASVDAGVALRWQALDEFEQLAVDRRLEEGDSWVRLAAVRSRQRLPGGEYSEYEYIDRSAATQQSYVYRIVGIVDGGSDVVLGELSVRFSPPIAARLVVDAPSPNPFNPSTRIRFSIPRAQNVDVRILDSAGRLVARLWNAELGPGRHDLTWNGTDAQGALVPSGIYHCSVRTRSEQQNRKLVLIK